MATAKKRPAGSTVAEATRPSPADRAPPVSEPGVAPVEPYVPPEAAAPPISEASSDIVRTPQRVAIDRARSWIGPNCAAGSPTTSGRGEPMRPP